MPVNQRQYHWVLIVVSLQDKSIQFLCSCQTDGTIYLNLMYKFLQFKWNQYFSHDDNLKHQFDTYGNGPWKLINSKSDVPLQGSNNNCGIFLCMFADVISNGLEYQNLISHVINKRGRMFIMSEIIRLFGPQIDSI